MEGARGAEEPHLVLLDRSAEGTFDVPELIDAVGRLQTAGLEVRRQVVGLEVLVLIAGEHGAAVPVAAVARDHVQADPAARDVGAGAAGRVDHFLAHRAVEVVLHGAVAVEPVDKKAVHLHRGLRGAEAVRRHVGLLHRARTAHVRNVQRHSGDDLAHRLNSAARGDRVERLAIEDLRLGRALDVDGRRRTGHGERFLEGPDPELAVDRHREVGGQFDPISLHGGKPCECEGDRVHAWPEIRQAISARGVGDGRARLLDEDRACGFDGDAGQHRTRRVFDNAGE